MSQQVSALFKTEFDEGVRHVFQDRGSKLLPLIRNKRVNPGEAAKFFVAGSGTAAPKNRHDDVPVMNGDRSNVTVTLDTYYAGEWIDEEDLDAMAPDDRDTAQAAAAMALGRKVDDIIIAALADTTVSAVGDYSAPMSVALAQQARERALTLEWPDQEGDWLFLGSPNSILHMETYKQFSNAEWVGGDDLPFKSKMKMRWWNGMFWMPHNRLPLSGDDQKNYLIHLPTVLGAVGRDVTTTISWENIKGAWFVNGRVRIGAGLHVTNGVIPIHTDNDTAFGNDSQYAA
jgi:hypothetical protein